MIMAAAATAAAPQPPPPSPLSHSSTTSSTASPSPSPRPSPCQLECHHLDPNTVTASDCGSDTCPSQVPLSPLPTPLPSACSAHQALATLLSPPKALVHASAAQGPPPSSIPLSHHLLPSASAAAPAPTSPPTGDRPCPHLDMRLHSPPCLSSALARPQSTLSTSRLNLKSSFPSSSSSTSTLLTPTDRTRLLANQVFSSPAIARALVHAMQSNDSGGYVLFPYLTLSRAMYHAIVQAWWARMDLKNPWALDLIAQRLVAHAAEADVEAAMADPVQQPSDAAADGPQAGEEPSKTDENACVTPHSAPTGSSPRRAENKPMSPVLLHSRPASDPAADDLDAPITDADLANLDDFVEDEDPAASGPTAVNPDDADTSIQDVSMLNLSAYLALPPLRIPDPIADNLAHLATTTRHVSLIGIKSYAHASRHAPSSSSSGAGAGAARFVQSDAMPAATYLLSRTPYLTSLHLDLAMIPSSVTVAHALDALPSLTHLHLRDTSPAGIPLSGKLVYSVFGHPHLRSLDLYHVHVHHSLEIHARLASKNTPRALDRSPLRRLTLVTDRFALVGPLADHLRSMVFLLDVLPALAHVEVRAANVPHVLLDAIANTYRPNQGKQGVDTLVLDLPARAELPVRWVPARLLPLGAGRLDPPAPTPSAALVPHIKHLTVRSLGTLPRPLPPLLSALPLLESLSLSATNNSIFLLNDTLATHPRLTQLTLAGDIEPGTLPLLGLPPAPVPGGLAHLHFHGDQPLCTLALMRLMANVPRNQLRGFTLMAGTFLAADPIGAPLRPVPAWLVAWMCAWQAGLERVGLLVRNHADEVDVALHALAGSLAEGAHVSLAFARCASGIGEGQEDGACRCLTRAQIRKHVVQVVGARGIKVRVLDVHRCPPKVKVHVPAAAPRHVFMPVVNPLLSPTPGTATAAAGLLLSPSPAAPGGGRKRKRTDAGNPPPPASLSAAAATPMSPPSAPPSPSSFSTPAKHVSSSITALAAEPADADVEDALDEEDEVELGTPRKRIGLTPSRGGPGTPRAVPVLATTPQSVAIQKNEEQKVVTRVRKVDWGQVKVVEVDKWIEDVVDEW